MSEIKTYEENRLKLEVKYGESEILIKWFGESKDREPTKFLTPILMQFTLVIRRSRS